MTALDMSELRRLEAAATQGEWVSDMNGVHRGRECVALTHSLAALSDGRRQNRADAALIAALRNAAPALLDAAGSQLKSARDWAVALEQENARLIEGIRTALAWLDEAYCTCDDHLCIRHKLEAILRDALPEDPA